MGSTTVLESVHLWQSSLPNTGSCEDGSDPPAPHVTLVALVLMLWEPSENVSPYLHI